MLSPDARAVAFELIRAPDGYRLDFAVLTTYTLDLEALLVLPLSILAHQDESMEELLADPVRLHQALRDAGDRVHVFVDETGIGVPRAVRALYAMLEPGVHGVRAPGRGSFHAKVWVARFTAIDDAQQDQPPLLRVAVLSRNLTFDRSWDIALASEASPRGESREAATGPLGDFLDALPRLTGEPLEAGSGVPSCTALDSESPPARASGPDHCSVRTAADRQEHHRARGAAPDRPLPCGR